MTSMSAWAVHEVLVVSADADLLAEAGALGLHRLRATDPAVTADAVRSSAGSWTGPDRSRTWRVHL